MYYKLSNIAERTQLESNFEVKFRFPRLYTKSYVINGMNEELLTVITQNTPYVAKPAIWGILPEKYEDDWRFFQEITNTLNVNVNDISSQKWWYEALLRRRCLIMVTGFFTNYIQNGVIYPYYVYLPQNEPFLLAGIYNKLEDGFITCSLLTSPANNQIKKIQHLSDSMPVYIPKNLSKEWLSPSKTDMNIKKWIDYLPPLTFKAHPIAKEFFKNNISYDSMLEPVFYDHIPKRT
ncbi:SOS response-associated peptidase [Ascidiimonas sp. W6]|uniref:SOS response-associated peptidase n=1 Tax=Ascidiimonas meishanensis TaxID=3128903 RepID=UPI0030ED220C